MADALDNDADLKGADIKIERKPMPSRWDWPLDAPLSLQVPARSFDWQPAETQALPGEVVEGNATDTIRLIPYGCTKFRISMFPVTVKAWEDQIFGQWLLSRGKGVALRLVIEEMNQQAAGPSAASAEIVTDSNHATPRVSFSSGKQGWPWKAEKGDPCPTITWTSPAQVEFVSLKLHETSDKEWIRRIESRSPRMARPGGSWFHPG